jgi:hypothetical protein
MMTIIIVFLIQSVFAAPHTKEEFPKEVSATTLRRLVQMQDKEDSIKKLGPEGYKQLREMMFSSQESVDDRWKATLVLAKIGGPESLPDLETALKNSLWYMRAAGLLGTSVAVPQVGYVKAKEFLHTDPALLVRAVALQVIAQQKTIDKEFLWSEIYNPVNFNNGKSLPIRLSILKVLENSLTASDTARLTALMREDNKDIQSIAKNSLSRIYALKNKKDSSR